MSDQQDHAPSPEGITKQEALPPTDRRLSTLYRVLAEAYALAALDELQMAEIARTSPGVSSAGRGRAAALGQTAADCGRAAKLYEHRGEIDDARRIDALGDIVLPREVEARSRLARFISGLPVSPSALRDLIDRLDDPHGRILPLADSGTLAERILTPKASA